MRSFKPYLLGATVFAAVLTVLAMNDAVSAFIGKFDALILVPIVTAILISNNAHMPSEIGIYLGFFIQWFIVGIAVAALAWAIFRKKADAGT